MDALEDILLDKLAMESMSFEDVKLEYTDFGSHIDELVVRNLPGHFRSIDWPLAREWSTNQLVAELSDCELDIAVTPRGNADSPVGAYFVKPFVTRRTLRWLLDKLQHPDGRQYYFQSQDDNLRDLNCSVPKHLPAAASSRFLGEQQAANLWIGTAGTTSRLHSDNFDNIYVQVAGTKRMYLLPPSSILDVDETMLIPATYNSQMEIVKDEDAPPVLFPTYDPSTQAHKRNTYVVDLQPGDVLFLPALWYHQVEILTPELNISLNYWYTPFDDERRWSAWNMTRQLVQLMKQNCPQHSGPAQSAP